MAHSAAMFNDARYNNVDDVDAGAGAARPAKLYAPARYADPRPSPGAASGFSNPAYSLRAAGFGSADAPLASPAAGGKRGCWDFMQTRWARFFMGTATLQAVLCLAFEAYVFAEFQQSLGTYVDTRQTTSQYKTIPTFLTLFIFGFIYELLLAWDALRMKNTIQIIGICIANLALLVYTAIQVDQIRTAVSILRANNALTDVDVWSEIRAYLVAIPCILAVGTIAMAFEAWKLYREFAWVIMKNISADLRMTRRYLHYQIYIALLKFDFFFFLGFTVQFVVVVSNPHDPEFALHIAAIPIFIAMLLLAAYFVRHENKAGMILTMVLYLAGLAYFCFKLVRIYQPSHAADYMAVRRSLTAFAVLAIILLVLTFANAWICMCSFNKGLKAHISGAAEAEKPDSTPLADVKSNTYLVSPPSRMTIE